jgi:hypothetical protein
MYLSKEILLCQKQEHLPHGFAVRFEVAFERNLYCQSEFSRWRKPQFVPHRDIQIN